MAISDKLTYLNTTKGKIKDVINKTNANIDNQTTFRNYAQALYNGYINVLKNRNTLLDNMNIGTSTGAISDSANLPIYEDKMSKLSTQDGTPSPNNPVEVKTVKGYRNLFDEEYYNNASLYSSPSTLFRYFAYVKMPDSFKTKFYGNMTLKGTSQNLVFGFSTSDNGVTSRMLNNGTLTSNVEYDFTNATNVYLIIGNSNDIDIARDIPLIFNNYNIIISKTSNKPYVPYGTNWIYTTINGKNLASGLRLGYYDSSTGNYVYNNSLGCSINRIKVKTGSSYIFSINGVVSTGYAYNYDKNNNYIDRTYIGTTGKYTPANNVAYFDFAFNDGLISKVPLNSNIQIEEGNEVTTFEEYKEKIITIPLNDNEICGIGDYKDELIVDKNGHCWLDKKIGKVVNEIAVISTLPSGYVYGYKAALWYNKKIGKFGGICNKALFSTDRTPNTFYENNSSFVFVGDTNDTLETMQQKYNGADVYYVLETSQLIDLNYNVDLTLYEGSNTITNSEDMDMAIKYIKNVYE